MVQIGTLGMRKEFGRRRAELGCRGAGVGGHGKVYQSRAGRGLCSYLPEEGRGKSAGEVHQTGYSHLGVCIR